MAKIVVVEMPAPGHVNPTLPIVRELIRRGEHVIYYADEEFRGPVEATGATFRAYPAGSLTTRDLAEATQSGDMLRAPAVILRATETLLPFILEELKAIEPDAIMLDSNALWGHMAGKQLGLRTVSLMTTFMLGSTQMKRVTAREWLHLLLPALSGLPRILEVRSRLMKRFGKAAFPKSPAFPARGHLNIAFLPKEFQAENPLVDETFRFVGPTVDLDAQVGAFDVALSKPIVYISLGTLHLGSTDFFQQCFEAFGDRPASFVLAVGKQTDIQALGAIPENFTVRQTVPQLDVLRHASAFITHGGMNSVLEALAFGLPLVLIPQQVEQLLIALHVADLGAGVVLREHMRGRRVVASALRGALDEILTAPSYREAAGATRQLVVGVGGYRLAADTVQAFIAGRNEGPPAF